jgi:single-strand DNA-binding protein
MLNEAIIQGNLVADPDTWPTKTGDSTTIVSARVACNNKRRDNEETLFLDVTLFGKTGEAFARFMKKGDQTILQGRLVENKWTDRDTQQPRSKIKLIANTWHFVGGKKD